MLTVKETAELLNCSERHVWRLIESGKLRPNNIGTGKKRILRISEDQIRNLGIKELSMSQDAHTDGRKPTILLDMDGVLVNFVQGVIDVHGLDISHDQWTDWNYHRTIGLSDDQFWQPTKDYGFWYNLREYDWCKAVLEVCQKAGNVVICSTPRTDDEVCTDHKLAWIESRFGYLDICFIQDKSLLANPNTVLIDDSDSNVEKFAQAGGKTILFPQPWNGRFRYLPLRGSAYVRDGIAALCN